MVRTTFARVCKMHQLPTVMINCIETSRNRETQTNCTLFPKHHALDYQNQITEIRPQLLPWKKEKKQNRTKKKAAQVQIKMKYIENRNSLWQPAIMGILWGRGNSKFTFQVHLSAKKYFNKSFRLSKYSKTWREKYMFLPSLTEDPYYLPSVREKTFLHETSLTATR